MSKFDIESFPTSETAKRMLRRVSPVYENSYFMKWIYQVMGTEWDEAREIVESLREQAFTQTVTWGIEMQEHAYSITPDDSLSLEERRARLYRKKTKKFPLNPGVIEQYIKNGWGMTTDVDETYASGVLKLTTDELLPRDFDSMLADVYAIKPSHLSLYAELRLHGELDLVSGFALPIAQDRLVDISPPKDGIGQPMSIGFMTKDTFQETRAAVPLKAAFGFAVSLRQGPLFPHHVKAQDENIEIPDRLGDECLNLAIGTLLWMPSGAIQNRLPSWVGTGFFIALRASPMTGDAVQVAPPKNTERGSLFIGLLHTALLPRHVNVSGSPLPETCPQKAGFGIRVGMTAHGGSIKEVLPSFPRGLSARSALGVLAGEALWHVNSRKE